MNYIIEKIQLWIFRKKWRKINNHNTTVAANMFNLDSVKVGNFTYGALKVVNWNKKNKLLIGNFCSIAQNVTFILDADHYTNHISSFPFKTKILTGELEGVSKGNIIVDDDVWIGYGVTILSGVHIGQGAVIAAGAVVARDVPPYAIIGGVPAKVIRYRFESSIIDELIKIDYSKLDKNIIEKYKDELYMELNNKEQLRWIPHKE